MFWIITGITVSYLIGCIPTAFIFGKIKGIDIRRSGSGNIGATNALRVLGKGAGISVLVIDILKGFIAVAFIGDIFITRSGFAPGFIRIIFALAVIAGHNWTVFLNFKGGKGVATTLGALFGLASGLPGLNLVLILAIATWVIVFLISRIVSLASIISGLSLPVYMAIFIQDKAIIILGGVLSFLVISRHKSNIKRIFQGTEKRINFRKHS
ncbi:MAG: glycerol-3-phosphate 1-O-acyltransferase [Candidatus Omnitrophota bacterium]|jgi:glycerol-3-phosphate acyltransferase PlsY|nr:MAG: glycerol-3-phosphate 1-O-acyltransferase [Candidatus Omnitrophota bacterium]